MKKTDTVVLPMTCKSRIGWIENEESIKSQPIGSSAFSISEKGFIVLRTICAVAA